MQWLYQMGWNSDKYWTWFSVCFHVLMPAIGKAYWSLLKALLMRPLSILKVNAQRSEISLLSSGFSSKMKISFVKRGRTCYTPSSEASFREPWSSRSHNDILSLPGAALLILHQLVSSSSVSSLPRDSPSVSISPERSSSWMSFWCPDLQRFWQTWATLEVIQFEHHTVDNTWPSESLSLLELADSMGAGSLSIVDRLSSWYENAGMSRSGRRGWCRRPLQLMRIFVRPAK